MLTPRLYFKTQAIREDGEFLCLTDMWRAAEASESKRPAEWLRHEATQEFSAYLETMGAAHSLTRTAEGRNGGTWAHWQLAMAYAKYLSPEFHAWCNEVVRALMQGRAPTAMGAEFAALRDAVVALTGVVTALATRVEEVERTRSSGVAGPWEIASIRRRVHRSAELLCAAGRYASKSSAIPATWNRVKTACGWSGKMTLLPAWAIPEALRELDVIDRECARASNIRPMQLSFTER